MKVHRQTAQDGAAENFLKRAYKRDKKTKKKKIKHTIANHTKKRNKRENQGGLNLQGRRENGGAQEKTGREN